MKTPRHTCHWPGCPKEVPPAMWGCRPHWYRLPQDLRNRIWRTYRQGQEVDKRPSAEYIEAAKAVQDWITSKGLQHVPAPIGDLFALTPPTERQ